MYKIDKISTVRIYSEEKEIDLNMLKFLVWFLSCDSRQFVETN